MFANELLSVEIADVDSFGKIIGEPTVCYFYGTNQQETIYARQGTELNIIGDGVVFTQDLTIAFIEGMTINLDGKDYKINKILKGKDTEGSFHHLELTYG